MKNKILFGLTVLLASTIGLYAIGEDRLQEISRITQSGAASLVEVVKVTNDTYNRFARYASGKMEWGSGAATSDVTLERSSTGVLDLSTGSLAIGGTTLAATVTELNRATDVSARVVAINTSTTITEAAHDGKILLMGGAGSARTHTLPAATGSGACFRFVVGAVNTSNYIVQVADGTDTIDGSLIFSGDNASNALTSFETAASSDTVTLNGTTTGGVSIGDYFVLCDVATDQYILHGQVTESGSEATPFSAAVP